MKNLKIALLIFTSSVIPFFGFLALPLLYINSKKVFKIASIPVLVWSIVLVLVVMFPDTPEQKAIKDKARVVEIQREAIAKTKQDKLDAMAKIKQDKLDAINKANAQVKAAEDAKESWLSTAPSYSYSNVEYQLKGSVSDFEDEDDYNSREGYNCDYDTRTCEVNIFYSGTNAFNARISKRMVVKEYVNDNGAGYIAEVIR